VAASAGEETGTRAEMTAAIVPIAEIETAFTCPACRGGLSAVPNAYACATCSREFPIVLGIPDFRIEPDPWIGIEDDRDKARRLEAMTQGASLEAMVRAYWSITPGTPARLAERFTDHVLSAAERSRAWLVQLDSKHAARPGAWLDVGTGTGDLAVVAAEHGRHVVGIDVAMRWLVVARRRAELAGVDAQFVCCNAEHLPFPPGAFARVVSLGTIEHCRDAGRTLTEAYRVLGAGGDVDLRTVNRFTVLPEPHVGVWGVGFLPRRWADSYVRARTGQGYEHHRPLSRVALGRLLARAGFRDIEVGAAALLPTERTRLGRLAAIAPWYDRARRTPIVRQAMSAVAPLLDARGVAR
jgi:SAM-dependent methyltransferase